MRWAVTVTAGRVMPASDPRGGRAQPQRLADTEAWTPAVPPRRRGAVVERPVGGDPEGGVRRPQATTRNGSWLPVAGSSAKPTWSTSRTSLRSYGPPRITRISYSNSLFAPGDRKSLPAVAEGVAATPLVEDISLGALHAPAVTAPIAVRGPRLDPRNNRIHQPISNPTHETTHRFSSTNSDATTRGTITRPQNRQASHTQLATICRRLQTQYMPLQQYL